MEGRGAGLSDKAMEAGMGRLLQAGVLMASLLVLAGGALFLRAGGDARVQYGSFASEPAALRNFGELLRAVGKGEPAALIQAGVLLLIATPVSRVVFALVAFAIERDRMYVAISVAVLTILLVSLFWVG